MGRGERVHLPNWLAIHLGISTSEARRIIATGGFWVDGKPCKELDVKAETLDGKLSIGRMPIASQDKGGK